MLDMVVDSDCVRSDLNSPDNVNSRWDFADVLAGVHDVEVWVWLNNTVLDSLKAEVRRRCRP
jgi:hypothetical protein